MSESSATSPAAMARARIIQGGMGVGVSSWRLAGAVGRAGGLGVVSGVALDTTFVRRLQDGDQGGHLREALARFPVAPVAKAVLDRYFVPGGRCRDEPYRCVPRLSLRPSPERQQLAVVAAFAEVDLARRAAGGAPVGINLLDKIQLATPAAAYGAMLAGVDAVLVGAGIPGRLPPLLDALASHQCVEFPIEVAGSEPSRHHLAFDPVGLFGSRLPPIARPFFAAIVSSSALAAFLARDERTRPDGFVVEGPVAGGHNAPPRGTLQLDERDEPLYGPRDAVDIRQFVALGLPFWLAGGYSRPSQLAAARAAGAEGVQVGTLFALARESGLAGSVRQVLLARLANEALEVRTDARASPTGYPFKVAQIPGTISEPQVRDGRRRSCDLGYLRTPYLREDGSVGYRCPAEPVEAYLRKGGQRADALGRVCLCNALMATIGLAQQRRGGPEPAIVTLGADLEGAAELLRRHPGGWGAADVVAYLSGPG